jgi:acetyl-CoA carboxylase alpha subunit
LIRLYRQKLLKNLADGTIAPEEAASLLLSRNTSASQMDRVMGFFNGNDAAKETIRRTIISDILGSVDEDIFVNEAAASSLAKSVRGLQARHAKQSSWAKQASCMILENYQKC